MSAPFRLALALVLLAAGGVAIAPPALAGEPPAAPTPAPAADDTARGDAAEPAEAPAESPAPAAPTAGEEAPALAIEPRSGGGEGETRDLSVTGSITVETKRLSEELVYSVTRVPERTFDTPRAVQVITAEQIRRKAAFELSDVLSQESGFFISPAGNGGGSVIVRGLASRQVLVMIDGVKLNNSTWRTFSDVKEHFNLLDPSEIERIEVVRGVVSVLGSEALGGVVNIITKKGPEAAERFGVTLTTRYSSADEGKAGAVQVHGQGQRYRYIAGVSGVDAADLTTGGGVEAENTAYERRAGHLHFDFSPTTEKTFSLGYRAFERTTKYLSLLQSPLVIDGNVDPMRMQMATLRYNDVTSRRWQDSLSVSASWNRQDDGRDLEISVPRLAGSFYNRDTMLGLNVELGKFLGGHHLIYGVDHSREEIGSSLVSYIGAARIRVADRGDYLDGGKYEATAIYLNDQFSLTKWLTVTAGARYGRYHSSGRETLATIGAFDADSTWTNVTSSLNVVVHATDELNFVANYVRGYRPPNMHDLTSASAVNPFVVTIPSVDIEAERMNSFEAGFKYDSGRFSGSAFYFDNDLSNILVTAIGTHNGRSFLDFNGDGRPNPGEPLVLKTANIGRASVHGYELDVRWLPTANLTLWGNYARTVGQNDDSQQTLSRIQPRLANAGVRFAASGGRRTWVEGVYSYGSESVGTNGATFPGFHVYTLRSGAELTHRVSLTLAVENLFDERYRFTPSISLVDQPGRQLVMVTVLRF
jgi:outer membrane receptor protein involved in Fe transport